jgi:hypothetical protein
MDFGFEAQADRRTIWSPAGVHGYGENDGFWAYDAGQGVGLHLWLAHSGARFPDAFERITVFLPDGELLVNAEVGRQHTDATQSGPHLSARCDEPFRSWSYRYDGALHATSVDALRRGPLPKDDILTPVRIDADLRMLSPPFPNGAFHRDQADYQKTPSCRFRGGFRFEQPLFAHATICIDGRWLRISGPGVRTHRKGARVLEPSALDAPLAKYVGHRWMHASFPSGRSIYYQTYGGRDGFIDEPEAYVRENGVFHRAQVVDPMPMSLAGPGDAWTFGLRSGLGAMSVDCEVVADSFQTMLTDEFFGVQWDTPKPDALAMSQAIVRYRCGGEATVNMMERSVGLDQLERPG